MKINCNNIESIIDIYKNSDFIKFKRGSVLYGTINENSDIDIGIIVPDNTEFIDIDEIFNNEKSDQRLHPCVLIKDNNKEIDIQFVKHSDFIDMINEHNVFALEAISIENEQITEYRKYFILDKWKLRQSFCSIVNNSWAKAHKKMTIEKDFDMKCGVKSLFHSIRIQEFAYQIANYGYIKDFTSCISLWNEIKTDWNSGFLWNDFKIKYKPIYNIAHSKIVNECPRP